MPPGLELDLAARIVGRFRPVDAVGTVGDTKHQPRIFVAGKDHLESGGGVFFLRFKINDNPGGHELSLIEVTRLLCRLPPYSTAPRSVCPTPCRPCFWRADPVVRPSVPVAHANTTSTTRRSLRAPCVVDDAAPIRRPGWPHRHCDITGPLLAGRARTEQLQAHPLLKRNA